jgi:FimV-like protein
LHFAKDRPQILGFPIDPSYTKGWEAAVASRMRDDGFDHVIVAPVDHDHILEPDWFRQTLQQLESVKAEPPSTHPSEAAADEPTRILNLAQAYISSGAPQMARKKLNQLIEKYPNDPAAGKARQLLDQLGGQ